MRSNGIGNKKGRIERKKRKKMGEEAIRGEKKKERGGRERSEEETRVIRRGKMRSHRCD